MSNNFKYFKYSETDRYSFFQIPKELITLKKYKSMSLEAKFLYGVLRDRNSLSVKNGWHDEDGNVYIYYTREEAQELLHCGKNYIVKVFKELQEAGLILEKRQGLGRANIIYVGEIDRQELEREEKSPRQTSGSPSKKLQGVPQTNANNTNINNTKENDTQSINQGDQDELQEIIEQSRVDTFEDDEVKETIKQAIKELHTDKATRQIIKRVKIEHITDANNRYKFEVDAGTQINDPMQYYKAILIKCINHGGFGKLFKV